MRLVPISQIVVPQNLPFRQRQTDALAQYLRHGGQVPPVHLQPVGERFRLREGRHRLAAHLILQRGEILARYAEEKS